MRRSSSLAVLAAISIVASACGSSSIPSASSAPASSAPASSAPAQQATVTFWKGPHTSGFSAESEQQAFAPLIADFESKNPGIKIEYLIIPWAQFNEKLTAGMSSNDPPDVVYSPNEWLFQFAQAGLLLNLDTAAPDLVATLSKSLQPDVWNMGKFAGNQVGVPWLTDGFFLYYNKKLFAAAGIAAPPTTYDELWKDAQALTKAPDQWGYAATATGDYADPYWMYAFLNSFGANIVNSDWTANGFNNPAGLQALTLYSNLFREKASPPAGSFTRDQLIELFLDGKIAMMQEEQLASGQALTGSHPNLELGVAKMPAGPGGQYAWGNAGQMFVSAKSKNQAAALKWLAYLNDSATLNAYFAKTDFWPAITSVTPSVSNPYLAQMGQLRDYLRLMPNHPSIADINLKFWTAVEPALRGSKTPADALAAAAEAVDAILKSNPVKPGG